jgi:hypothetical protein
MSLLFIDSFDHYGTNDIGLKWSGRTSQTVIAPTSGRRGGGALSVGNASSWAFKDVPGATTLIIGAAVKLGSFGDDFTGNWILYEFWGSTYMNVAVGVAADGSVMAKRYRFNSDGLPVLIGQSTGGIVPLNVYTYIEAKVTCHGTTGALQVLVNGVSVLNLTNTNTYNPVNPTTNLSRISLRAPNPTLGSTPTLYDDLYICDTAGTVNHDFFGDVRVDVALPNADGTYSEFTPDTGSAHYSRVNEAVADQLSYVASSTVGAKDTYQFADLTSIVGVIRGVQVVDAALKDDAGARSIGHIVRSGVSEQFSAAMPLSTDRKLYTTIHETDPATGIKWTQAGINAAEFGVYVAE